MTRAAYLRMETDAEFRARGYRITGCCGPSGDALDVYLARFNLWRAFIEVNDDPR